MKRCAVLVLRVALLSSLLPALATALPYIWTGIGNGWQGQVAPTGSGSENLVFGNNVSIFIKIPSPVFIINSVSFTQDNRFLFLPQSGSTGLNLGAGGLQATNPWNNSTTIDFDAGIALNLSADQTWDFGSGGGSAFIHGVLSGSNSLTITGSSNNSFGLTLASLTPYVNSSFTGGITLGNSTTPNLIPFLAVWASGNLGTGPVTFVNGGQIITHNATSLANSLVLNSGSIPSGNNNGQYTPINFKAWDAPMVLTGSVTLANNATINAQAANPNIASQLPGSTGSWPLAGPRTRYPIIFTGNIGESAAGTSLNITGPGLTILAPASGANTYTGGTNVGFATGSGGSAQGTLVFASQNAIPATGTLQTGLLNVGNAAGYVGIADTAIASAADFNTTFLNRFAANSSGSVGLDSLDGSNVPDATAHVYGYNIDLTHFTTTTSGGIRLGTATSIILTGSLTPQISTNTSGPVNTYNFGNGGGKMFVQTGLGNQSGWTTSLQTNNQGAFPLQLFLQGSNSYTGGTQANNGFIIFDGAGSIPATGLLRAGGASTSVGSSYLGFTNTTLGGTTVDGSASTGGLAEAGVGLFSKFDKANTWGIIGFDSTSLGSPVTVTGLDLTGFNDGVFVGTNSATVLSGTITPTTVTNGDQVPGAFRFTASSGGTLTVASNLTGGLAVFLGSFNATPAYSDGTVILGGANSYSGGTFISNFGNLSLVAGSNNAFGGSFGGTIHLQPHGGVIGLSTGAASVTIPNAIDFLSSGFGTITNFTPTLNLTGSNTFTLSGSITGPDRTQMFTMNDVGQGLIALNNVSPVNITLSGNNSSYYGTFMVQNGTMTFAADNAAGHAQIELNGPAGTVAFTSASPVVYGLWNGAGGGSTVTLGASTHLTVDTIDTDGTGSTGEGNGNYDFDFGGSFVGGGGSSLTINHSGTGINGTEFFYAYGSSPSFSGSVNITNHAALALGQSNSVGSGTITLDAVDGGLALNQGVTLINPLVFNQGGLAGIGTFDPIGVSGTGQTAGWITFGANQKVFAGIPGEEALTGTLTIGGTNVTRVVFANGGTLQWDLRDPAATDGYSLLNISGNLDITATLGGFTLALESIDASGNTGYSNALVDGQSYSLLIAQTTNGGTIYNFTASAFNIDVTKFQSGLIPAGFFSVTNPDATHLYLNFTAVPEPSTWALLAAGAGFLGLAAWRRSRRA